MNRFLPAVAVVGLLTLLGIVGPLVVYVGLARAGVTGWWLLVPVVAATVGSMVLPFAPLRTPASRWSARSR